MGKLFKSWFKKKKQESIIRPALETPLDKHRPPPTTPTAPAMTNLYTPDETPLTFTHGSLLDDVLNGLKDQHEHPKTKDDAPGLPLSTSARHLDSWSKIGTVPEHKNQQKQIIRESYGNNGSSTHQQNRVSQSYLSSPPPTPETPSDSLGNTPSTKVMTPPSSAATPSSSTPSSSSSSLSPPRLIQTASQHETSLVASLPPPHDQVDDSEESSSGPDTVGSNDISTNGQQSQQQKAKMTASQQHDTQHRLSYMKSPSIASSRESNHDKKNHRYSQATGVSMSRMKERHRQECRRSMQSPCQQQPSSDSYPHTSSTHHPSFQSTPLLNQQQQQQQQQQIMALPKSQQQQQQQQHRHLMTSPSMPSIYPVESMSPPLQTLSQQHHHIPAATNSATPYSFPPPPPSTISMARSSSLMTDIHYQQQSTPGSNMGTMTMSPLANDLMHPPPSWRHQPLFPYQSDIILPPYSPSQLGTFQQQHQQIMQSPYRVKQSLLPRSASVYGNANQYHYKYPSSYDLHHGSGALLKSPTMDFNGSRKSVPASLRPYQPQLLSISTQPSLDQAPGSKKQQANGGQTSPLHPSETALEASPSLPAFFLPSSSSPSKVDQMSSPQQQQQRSSLSSSASSVVSSPCTTPTTNVTQKPPTTLREADNDTINDTKDTEPVISRRVSASKPNNKGGLHEKAEMPPLGNTTSAAVVENEESNRSKKKHHRKRRRFSLPTAMPALSPSVSSSELSSDLNKSKNNSKKDRSEEYKGNDASLVYGEDLGKLEIGNDSCQHQHHHHPSVGSRSACPTSTTSNNSMHLCSGGVSSSTYNAASTTPCCPTSLPPTYQPPHQLYHHHHHPHQHYADHSCSCAHSPSLPPPPPSCCQVPPPPPATSCCSPRSHHHHHHHHRHHRSHHRHHHQHHSETTKQHMRKSKSCMTKAAMEEADDDEEADARTIGSATPTKSGHVKQKKSQQRRRHQQHHQSMPISQSMTSPLHVSDDNDDDDDHTVNGEDHSMATGQETIIKKSPSMQKPFLRSLLPRAPRFTSLPRTLQDQQHKQKKKMTTSKSSYSWVQPRA